MRLGRASATIQRRIDDHRKTLAFERAQQPESRRADGRERSRSKRQMRTRRMKRSPGMHVTISATISILAGAGVMAVLGTQLLFAGPQQTAGEKAAPPDKALTPYVEAHTHFEAKDPEGSVRAAVAAIERQNAAMVLLQMPPDTFDHPGHYDAEVVLAAAKPHPEIGVLGGGGTLNAMIIQAAASGDVSADLKKKFKDRAEELLREGVIGFGEMTAEHYSGVTPYQYAPADHPLYLLLADIAAEHGVPIDLHMEAVPEDMAVPPSVKVPPNPPRLRANIAAFERLLAHNPRAKIIWAHAGADGTGHRTPELCRRLLRAHANLVMEIKTDPKTQGMNYPLADGKIKPDWLALFKEFPDRFVIGSDQHYPEPEGAEQRWQEAVRLFNQLPADVRRKIGTENVARIYPKIASRLGGKKSPSAGK
jgi:predicted TIM-barrel fold metal-dependent hydrolase